MLALTLARLAASESISLSEANYGQISRLGKPLVLEFFNPFCGHCRDFAPLWHEFANESRFRDRVIFGHLNCLEHSAFCRKFGDFGYPHVLFIAPSSNSSVSFQAPFTLPGLIQLLEKQLGLPLRYIEGEPELEAAKAATNVSSLFIFRFENAADKRAEAVALAAGRARTSGCVFVGYRTNVTSLEVFRSPTFSLTYTGDWTLDSLSSFIDANRDCILPPLSSLVEVQGSSPPEFYFIVFLLQEMYQRVAEMIQPVETDIHFFYEVYSPDSQAVSKFRVHGCLPQFTLVDTLTPRFAVIQANSTTDLQQWIDSKDLLKWNFSAPDGGVKGLLLDWVGRGFSGYVTAIFMGVGIFLCIHRRCSKLARSAGRRQKIRAPLLQENDLGVEFDSDKIFNRSWIR